MVIKKGDRFRGRRAGGPHAWETYRTCLKESILIFGERNAGSHFMVGMGESEKEMGDAIQRVRALGGRTHLFSFFPGVNSQMVDHPVPPLTQYRRVQPARYLIDSRISRSEAFICDERGRIADFGLPHDKLEDLVRSGEPFRASGCEGCDGAVACNRPFANSRPGSDIRNYPFPPNEKDVRRIFLSFDIHGQL